MRKHDLITLLRSIVIIMLSAMVMVTSGRAQSSGSTTGAIDGNVEDPQHAALSGARVTARQIQTNLLRTTMAGEDGSFHFVQLPPGDYEVKAEIEGFNSATATAAISIGTTAAIEFTLTIAGGANVIEVKANNTLNENKTESSTTQSRDRIEGLPINRRNFLDFSLTSARVTIDRTPAQGITSSSGLSFNAQSGRRNNITIDGLDNNDAFGGSVRSTYSQDAVQEFQVVSDNYSAEFGRAVGGVVNIVTRGGTNEYHGSLFVLNRNDEISARDAFATFKPPYSQYQFGSTLGGPIKKDRAFFFTSFERLTIKQNNIVTITDQSIAAAQRQGFNVNNGPSPFSLGTTTLLARADAQLSANDSLWVRYNFGGTYNGAFDPFNGLVAETSTSIEKLRDNAFAIDNTYLNTNLRLANETRFLFNRRNQRLIQIEDGPQVQIFAPEGPIRFGRAVGTPFKLLENLYQFVDNVTITRTHHQLKFGGDFALRNTPKGESFFAPFLGGLAVFLPLDFAAIAGIPGLPSFTSLEAFDPSLRSPAQRSFLTFFGALLPNMFPGFPRGLPIADLSLPTVYLNGFGSGAVRLGAKSFSGFAQDDIKVRANLLIKAGVRYDINRIDFVPNNNGNFSPRIAFTYVPQRLPNLRLHGAYGIFFGGAFTGLSGPVQITQSGQAIVTQIPLPFSIVPFSLPNHRFPQTGQQPPGLQIVPQLNLTFEYQKNLRNTYTQQVTAGVDYRLGENTVVSVSYDFVRGIKLLGERNINPVVRPTNNPVESAIIGRVDTSKGDISYYATDGDSYYHGLTVQLERRFSNHFGLLAHYTFAKAIDDFFDIRIDLFDAPVNPLNIRAERGLSFQDVRNRFVASGIWDLSYTRNPMLTGFRLSTIINLNSGPPYNLLAGADLNRSGDNPPGDRPLIGGASVGRNTGILPGFANVDLRLERSVAINERFHIEAFAEVFNIFNHTNISGIDRVFAPDAQGNFNLPEKENGRFIAPRDRYRSAFAPRQFQFGFKFRL